MKASAGRQLVYPRPLTTWQEELAWLACLLFCWLGSANEAIVLCWASSITPATQDTHEQGPLSLTIFLGVQELQMQFLDAFGHNKFKVGQSHFRVAFISQVCSTSLHCGLEMNKRKLALCILWMFQWLINLKKHTQQYWRGTDFPTARQQWVGSTSSLIWPVSQWTVLLHRINSDKMLIKLLKNLIWSQN